MQFLVLLLLLLLNALHGSFATEHYVRSSTQDLSSCRGNPCLLLGEYARNSTTYFTSGASFFFLNGEHLLDELVTLTDTNGVTMRGESSGARVIVSAGAGISLSDSQDIVLSLMEISHRCGEESNNVSGSALVFSNTSDVEITNVKFTSLNSSNESDNKSNSRAVTFLQSTAQLTNCSFYDRHAINGGGVYAIDSIVTFSGANMFARNTAEVSGGAIYSNNSNILITGTNTFLGNRARTLLTDSRTGGGAIYAAERTLVDISGFVQFVENGPNSEDVFLIGGGVSMFNSALQVQDRAVFSRNFGSYAGAIHGENSNITLLGHMTFSDNRPGGSVSLFWSNFTCNGQFYFTNNVITIPEGFGSAIYSEQSTLSLSGTLAFENNTVINGVGGAIFTFSSTMSFRGNVSFAGNAAMGGIGGAMCIDRTIFTCEGIVTFTNNSAIHRGGGVYAIDSLVTITRSSIFTQNTAMEGGGMGFEGNTTLVLQSPVSIVFDRNRASSIGGALLFLDSSAIAQCQNISIERRNCFFQIQTTQESGIEDIQISLTKNVAEMAGSELYGGSLQLCRVVVNGEQITNNSFHVLGNISTFVSSEDDTRTSLDVTSDPLRVCSCDSSGRPNCSAMAAENVPIELAIERGKRFVLSIVTVGQGNVPVPATLRGYIMNSDNATDLSPQSHMINRKCTDIEFRLKSEGVNKVLVLYPGGPCGNTENTRKKVHVRLKPCPPGFEYSKGGCVCEERLLKLDRNNLCDIDTGTVERPGNTWVRPIWDENETYNGFILRVNCPHGYCRPENERVMLDFTSNFSKSECSENRTGVVCGECIEGHSITLSDFTCTVCSDNYISLVLFFAFAGVALIMVLLGLHMTVAAGTINGLILYANIVNVNRSIFFPPDDTNILTVFISWLNLDFGIRTCFYNGLSSYSYAWLNYIFPLYLWFLIGAIVLSCKLFPRIGRLFGSNPVAVLATVILMSYTKFLQISIIALSYTTLEYPDGTTKKVWLFDANIRYFEGKHIILAIAGLCVIFFIIIPFFLLITFGYRLLKYSGKKWFLWFNKFKPLLDAYYAPYHMKTRYWPGFMLIVRGFLYLAFSFNALGNVSSNLVAISSVFTAIAIIPWLNSRIYEKFYNDVLEASFLLNICILSTATYHVIATGGNQAAVAYLSVGVAFLQFLGITGYHIYIRTNQFRCLRCWMLGTHIRERIKRLKFTFRRYKKRKMSFVKVSLPVTTTVVELREPLLEENAD